MKRMIILVIGIVLLSGCGTVNKEYEERLAALEEKVDYLMNEKEDTFTETDHISVERNIDTDTGAESDTQLEANSIISFSMAGYDYFFSYPNDLEIADIDRNGLINEQGTYSYYFKNVNTNMLLVFSYTEEKYFSWFHKANGEGAKGFFLINGQWWYNPTYSGDDKDFAKQNGTPIEDDVYHSYVIEEVSCGAFSGYYYEMKDLTGVNEICFYNLFDSQGNNLIIQTESQINDLSINAE